MQEVNIRQYGKCGKKLRLLLLFSYSLLTFFVTNKSFFYVYVLCAVSPLLLTGFCRALSFFFVMFYFVLAFAQFSELDIFSNAVCNFWKRSDYCVNDDNSVGRSITQQCCHLQQKHVQISFMLTFITKESITMIRRDNIYKKKILSGNFENFSSFYLY